MTRKPIAVGSIRFRRRSKLSDASPNPNQMLLDFCDFFAIQERQQIAEPGVADQKLKACPAAATK